MNIPNEYVDIYNRYLKDINEVKKDIKSIEYKKRKLVRKSCYATEEEIQAIENMEEDKDEILTSSKKNHKIFKFSNGDIYYGAIENNKMEGKGIYTFFSKECIEKEKNNIVENDDLNQGDIVDDADIKQEENLEEDKMDSIQNKDYPSMEYIGHFMNNMKEGRGKFTFKDGDIYIGHFKEDNLEGIGQMTYSSGDEYIGSWKEGSKDGDGIYIWKDRWIYVGGFKSSKMDGYGVCYDNNGNLVYEGEWKNNLIHGQGIYIWDENKRYEGEFKHGKKHGQGTFYINNELVYKGTWKFDKPSIYNMTLEEVFSFNV